LNKETLPRPDRIDSDMWVSEGIWGHRLYDEQTPWLCFLEFLTVLQSELKNGRAFDENEYNSLRYATNVRLYLRNILFNNPHLEVIQAQYPDDDSRWRNWCQIMNEKSGGIVDADYKYLRTRFSSFKDFADIVKLIRATAIEGDSNKRWSSKFVFPYGPSCLYEDLEVTATGYSNDRRFFARSGELLYLMVSRSSKSTEVLDYLQLLGIVGEDKSVSPSNTKWNRLIEHLQPDTLKQRESGNPPYLPYKQSVDFENLTEDWLNIARCNMPGYDSLPHLVSIMGLHLIIYFLRRAQMVLGMDEQPKFILEILAPKRTVLRDLASESFLQNNNLSSNAIAELISRTTALERWQSCSQSEDPMLAASMVLKELFAWPEKLEELENIPSPQVLLDRLKEAAIARHKKHLHKFQANWAREIGLSSSRGSRRTRYVTTDALLKTLVFATVHGRMEFQQFLSMLHQKYGFIIGDKEAVNIIERHDADQEDFNDNATRLEQRLASIGLLKRLSDACAYVQNPFSQEQD
jgi:hypothetical protein